MSQNNETMADVQLQIKAFSMFLLFLIQKLLNPPALVSSPTTQSTG